MPRLGSVRVHDPYSTRKESPVTLEMLEQFIETIKAQGVDKINEEDLPRLIRLVEQADAVLGNARGYIVQSLRAYRGEPDAPVEPAEPAKPAWQLVAVTLQVRENVEYLFRIDVDPTEYDSVEARLDFDDPDSVAAWARAWAEDESNWVDEISLTGADGGRIEVTEREHEVIESDAIIIP